jgi:hypothetical protein
MPYHYVSDEDKPIVEMKEACTKSLRDVKGRLELLGSTITWAGQHYLKMMVEQNLDLEISDLTFDAFVEALWWVDLNAETPDFKNDCDFGTAYDRESCSLLSKALPDELFSPRRLTLEETLSKLNLDAWSILRIFALNPDPQDLPVTWQFADLIEGGWAHRQRSSA